MGDPAGGLGWWGGGGEEPVFALTGAQATSMFGLTLDALYLMQESSGNVADSVGSNTLTVNATPAFQYSMPYRNGINYDSGGDRHGADVLALGTGSGWYAATFVSTNNTVTRGIVGRSNSGLTETAVLYAQPTTGYATGIVRDDGVNSLVLSTTTNVHDGQLWLAQLQVDRAANQARARFSAFGGAASTASGSISGFSTLDGASQLFGFGSVPGYSFGIAVSWGAAATGVQCEGASLLADIAASMGFP